MPEPGAAFPPARSIITVSLFRDVRDVIPVRAELPWTVFCGLVAPRRPEVRQDVAAAADRQQAFIDDVCAALLSGRRVKRFQHLAAHRELEKVAYRCRAEGMAEAAVVEQVRARAESLREAARRRAKHRLPCWSPTLYPRHATRGASSVEAVTCLVLDHDDGASIEDAVSAWEGWPLMVHSSWSHSEAHPRFRLVLPLAEPVPAGCWPRAWAWANERAGGHIDPACKDPSRLYLRPAIPHRTAPYQAFVRDGGGPLLGIDPAILATPRPSERPAERPMRAPSGHLPRVTTTPERARLVARQRLRTNREVRERAARWLGATILERRADKVVCPRCGRPSVWFWLEPGSMSTARCSHRESCGWWGHLDELLDAGSVTHER